jgi:hypothetical protein
MTNLSDRTPGALASKREKLSILVIDKNVEARGAIARAGTIV